MEGYCDGWFPSNDVWVYASASSFTIAGVDRTSLYTQGTRIKCTNNSTTFYGTVISPSYSTDTTVNLAPNDDYTLDNSTISLPFILMRCVLLGILDYLAILLPWERIVP